MIKFVVRYDVDIFGSIYYNEFVFQDYDVALSRFIDLLKDSKVKNINIIKEVYKLVSCEVVK